MSIKVLTLNCWGVGYAPVWLGGSKDRGQRVQAIARYLAGTDEKEEKDLFDVVCLQEMWVSQDRESIKAACRHVFPHSREYFGGVIGTGLMILSRHPIAESEFWRFTLNGFLPAFWLGDGAAAKGVAVASIRMPNGLRVNVYNTHFHAEYNRSDDWYVSDRTSQALETALFINNTTKSLKADVSILAGDLNCQKPNDLPWSVVTRVGEIDGENANYPTYGYPSNVYSGGGKDSVVIDHILHRGRKRVRGLSWDTKTVKVWKAMLTKVPGLDNISYSDHESVAAEILATPRLSQDTVEEEEVKKRKDYHDDPSPSFQSMNKSVGSKEVDKPERELLLLEVLALMEKESWWAWGCQIGTVLLALAFPIFVMQYSLDSILGFVLGALWAGLALTAVVLLQERRNALKQVSVSINDKIEVMRKSDKNSSPT